MSLVVGVLVAAVIVRREPTRPLALSPAPAPAAGSADCARLLTRLPATLDGGDLGALDRRQVDTPAPPGAVAWGDPPVVLRCGVSRPAELTLASRLLLVSGVQYLEIRGGGSGDAEAGTDTWVAVDRPVYVAVELPAVAGSAPLQQLTEQIRDALPAHRLDLTP